MYKIIGADQKEYGPVTADQINAWILEGRADGKTQARAESSTEWKPLSGFSEFATALSIKSTGAPPIESKDPGTIAAAVLARGVAPDIGRCLRQGWKLLLENLALFLGAAVLLVVIRLAIGFIPIVGGIVNWILYGAFYGGFYLIFLKRLRGQPASVGELFSGFSQNFSQLMLTSIVSQLLISIGMIFCWIPGIYLTVAWKFSLPLVMDKGLEFWPAMEVSRKVITRHWFQLFGLMLIAFLPVVLFMTYMTFRIYQIIIQVFSAVVNSGQFDIGQFAGLATRLIPLMLGQQLLMLLTLPFATAALMQAYEDLFGPRPAPAA